MNCKISKSPKPHNFSNRKHLPRIGALSAHGTFSWTTHRSHWLETGCPGSLHELSNSLPHYTRTCLQKTAEPMLATLITTPM